MLAALLLASCDSTQPPSPIARQAVPIPYQRFIPVPRQPENVQGIPWSGAFALDTKTGQLCFTYIGPFPKEWLDYGVLPCLQLLKNYPDAADGGSKKKVWDEKTQTFADQ